MYIKSFGGHRGFRANPLEPPLPTVLLCIILLLTKFCNCCSMVWACMQSQWKGRDDLALLLPRLDLWSLGSENISVWEQIFASIACSLKNGWVNIESQKFKVITNIFIMKIYFKANLERFTKFLNYENLELYSTYEQTQVGKNVTSYFNSRLPMLKTL